MVFLLIINSQPNLNTDGRNEVLIFNSGNILTCLHERAIPMTSALCDHVDKLAPPQDVTEIKSFVKLMFCWDKWRDKTVSQGSLVGCFGMWCIHIVIALYY